MVIDDGYRIKCPEYTFKKVELFWVAVEGSNFTMLFIRPSVRECVGLPVITHWHIDIKYADPLPLSMWFEPL